MMRVRRFQSILRKNNISFALIAALKNRDVNMFYFTGLDIDYSFLIIPKKGNSILFTNKLEYERACRFSKVRDVRLFEKPVFEYLGKNINKRGAIAGINKSVVSLNAFKEFRKHFKKKRYMDISRLLLEARQQKQADEIKNLSGAARIADSVFHKLVKNFSFRTELDVEKFLHDEAHKHGCELSFPPIVASGKNASMPHYRAQNVKLKKGFLLLDFGINYRGYMSDISRTVYLGKPSPREKELYSLLLDVQQKAIRHVRPGMKAGELMKFVRKGLGRYDENFIHGLGHGVGVQIHELPSIHDDSKDVFGAGDVFTVEPGIYLPGKLGMRIEDDVLLLQRGVKVLTKSRKSLICI